jgi:hypothetical protein
LRQFLAEDVEQTKGHDPREAILHESPAVDVAQLRPAATGPAEGCAHSRTRQAVQAMSLPLAQSEAAAQNLRRRWVRLN